MSGGWQTLIEDTDSKDRAEVLLLRPNWSGKKTRLRSNDWKRDFQNFHCGARQAPWDEKLSRTFSLAVG